VKPFLLSHVLIKFHLNKYQEKPTLSPKSVRTPRYFLIYEAETRDKIFLFSPIDSAHFILHSLSKPAILTIISNYENISDENTRLFNVSRIRFCYNFLHEKLAQPRSIIPATGSRRILRESHWIPQENTVNIWNMEAVFPPGFFPMISGKILSESTGNCRHPPEKFPTGILLPTS
jgi:hypothetical protein